MIEKEIQNASHGLPSGIFAKVNSRGKRHFARLTRRRRRGCR